MQTTTRRRQGARVVALIGLLAAPYFLVAAWYSHPSVRGSRDAEADLARGHLEVKSYGLSAEWSKDYARMLEERYDVHVDVVSGCVVSEELKEYVHAYNSVSESKLREKYGRDILSETAKEAKDVWARSKSNR